MHRYADNRVDGRLQRAAVRSSHWEESEISLVRTELIALPFGLSGAAPRLPKRSVKTANAVLWSSHGNGGAPKACQSSSHF